MWATTARGRGLRASSRASAAPKRTPRAARVGAPKVATEQRTRLGGRREAFHHESDAAALVQLAAEHGEPVRGREGAVVSRRVEVAPVQVVRVADEVVAQPGRESPVGLVLLRPEPLER